MTGHATPAEEAEASRLRLRVEEGLASIDEQLELACLLMEPLHQEDQAVNVLRTILRRDPACWIARVWLAYCDLQYFMDDESLRAGSQLLEQMHSDDAQAKAASLMLRAGLGGAGDTISSADAIRLLEESVAAAPWWVNNRWSLAVRLAAAGRLLEADEQFAAAQQNVA